MISRLEKPEFSVLRHMLKNQEVLKKNQLESAHPSTLTVSAPMLFDDQSLAYNKGGSGPPPPPDY